MELKNKKAIALLIWLIDWWGRLCELWGINYHLPFILIAYLAGEWWRKREEKEWKVNELNLLANYDNSITDEDCIRLKVVFSHELECFRCQKKHNLVEKKQILWARNSFADGYQKGKKLSRQKRIAILKAIEKVSKSKNSCSPLNNSEFNLEWQKENHKRKVYLREKNRKKFCKKQFKKSLTVGLTLSLILSFTIIFIKYWPNLPWES